ncbi:DUF1345 domain-containing protein [Pseudokineococcus sp. 1T1Z-3]|uniref:DUF1345 domain-containing protein n=1 Tax=Pseudokineococcus sp. 1T1Z-3 TaxID=3132745 RepID=UPI0030957369
MGPLAGDARRRLQAELVRGLAAFVGALPAAVVAVVVDSLEVAGVLAGGVFLAAFLVLYVLLTAVAFGGLRGEALQDAAQALPADSSWRAAFLGTQPGGGVALVGAVGGLVAAAALLPLALAAPGVLAPAVITALALVLVLSGWAAVVATYAVDYLRRDVHQGGLTFPGEDERVFADYTYLAIAVSTSVSTSDVLVTSSALRRVVRGHMVAAFAFNTVVITLALAVVATLTR